MFNKQTNKLASIFVFLLVANSANANQVWDMSGSQGGASYDVNFNYDTTSGKITSINSAWFKEDSSGYTYNFSETDVGSIFDVTDTSFAYANTVAYSLNILGNIANPFRAGFINFWGAKNNNSFELITNPNWVATPFFLSTVTSGYPGPIVEVKYFDAPTLTLVAAVPEAEEWAMMLLGLGMVGVVARRKKSALTA